MAEELPSGAIWNLINHLFTGAASDAVVAVLMLVVVLLGFTLWQVHKRLLQAEKDRATSAEEHAKVVREINKEYQDTLKDNTKLYQELVKDLNESYQEFTRETTNQNASSASDMVKSLSAVQTTIAEMKTVVSIITLRGPGYGTPT